VTLLRRLPIRHRLVLGIVALLALVLLASGVLVTRILHDRLVDDIDEQLGQRTVAIARAFRPRGGGLPGGDRGAPNPFAEQRAAFVELDAGGRIVASIPLTQGGEAEPLPDVVGTRIGTSPRTVGSVDDGGPRYRVRAVGLGANVIVAGISLEDVDASVRSARQALVVGGLLTLVAAAAVVWFTVRRGLRPIDAMITTAGHIAAGDLTERAPVPDPATEVGQLGTALNTMLDNIEAAIGARVASEDRLRRFAADASHELRTPLTSIRGYAELYRQGATDPDSVSLGMARIEREATRMSELVEDLLLLARLDQGHELRLDVVDLTEVVGDAVDAARVVEPGRAIDLDLPVDRVTLHGDGGRLRQVIDNLLANVREHTGPDAPVHVTLTSDGDAATLVVQDAGPGMTQEEAERAFERFWQGEQTIEHPRHGTGLGLAIVHDLVRTHGGSVSLDTAPGAGATFTIVLPRAGLSGDSQATGSGTGDSTRTVRP
jgi:two-component system OmpR family sensor kinase